MAIDRGCTVAPLDHAHTLVSSVINRAPSAVLLRTNIPLGLGFALNGASPYASSFLRQNPRMVGYITYIDGVQTQGSPLATHDLQDDRDISAAVVTSHAPASASPQA